MKPIDRQTFAWLFLAVVPVAGLVGLIALWSSEASIYRNAPEWAVRLANGLSIGAVASTLVGVFLASRARIVASFLAAAVVLATGLLWGLVMMAFSNSWL